METTNKIHEEVTALQEELERSYNEISTLTHEITELLQKTTGKKHFTESHDGRFYIKPLEALQFICKSIDVLIKENASLKRTNRQLQNERERVSQTGLFRG